MELKTIQAKGQLEVYKSVTPSTLEDMVPYYLVGNQVNCHHVLPGGGGTGKEYPEMLFVTSHGYGEKWYTNQRCALDGVDGWV